MKSNIILISTFLFLLLFVLQAKSQATMDNINKKIIEKTRTVNCSIDSVWWKWTTHEGLKTFFGVDNKVNLEIGGEYEIYFVLNNPNGQKGGEGNKILSFLPNKMLSFTWNAPPQFSDIRNHNHKTWVVLDFEAVSENKTLVKLNHLGWLDGKNWDTVYSYFDGTWSMVLDWLEKSCNK
jgi:uncharacterized protein YndB with AHSA1/START domain